MKHMSNGSWELDLGGICFRELLQLGELLHELGDKGNLEGTTFDLETLKATFNANTGEVTISDSCGDEY